MPEALSLLAAVVAIIGAIAAVAAALHVRQAVDALFDALEAEDDSDFDAAVAATPAAGAGAVTLRVRDRGEEVVLFVEVGDACRMAAALTPKEASDLADILLEAGYAAAQRTPRPEPGDAA